jgi:hypothetical protein
MSDLRAARVFKRAVVGFMMATLVVGLIRFGLTISGAADDIAKYSSMTVIILAGCLYFGVQNLAWRDLAWASYCLILPYVTVELGAIGYTWATGKATIFHSHQYSFGLPVGLHFWGHLVGGLTWEPLSIFVVMLIVRALSTRWTSGDMANR